MIHPRSKRKFDLDNTLKAILDALMKADMYNDDSQIDYIEIARKVRERVGDSIGIMIDVHMGFDTFNVTKLGKELEKLNLLWCWLITFCFLIYFGGGTSEIAETQLSSSSPLRNAACIHSSLCYFRSQKAFLDLFLIRSFFRK